jgi:predicted PurR-regulated permease PerM
LPNWSARQVAIATVFVVAVGLAFWFIYQIRTVIFILFIAIVLGTAIRPGVDWLKRRGLPRAGGVIVIYLAFLCLAIGFVFLVIPLLTEQGTALAVNIPDYYERIRSTLLQSPSLVLQRLGLQLPPRLFLLTQEIPTEAMNGEPLGRVARSFETVGLLTRWAFILIAVFLLGFYWTLESEKAIRGLLMLLPAKRRDSLREIIGDIESKVGGFIRGQIILSFSVGGMALIAYLLIDLPYALILAITAGIMEAIPVFGPTLGAIPALLVALSVSPMHAVWVLLASVIIQLIENYLLGPRVMNKAVGVHPIVVLLALAAFTSLLGLPGAFLAIPMAAISQLLLDRFVLTPSTNNNQIPQGRDRLNVLRYEAQDLAQDVRKQLRQMEEPSNQGLDQVEDAIETIALELDQILAQVDQNGTSPEEVR